MSDRAGSGGDGWRLGGGLLGRGGGGLAWTAVLAVRRRRPPQGQAQAAGPGAPGASRARARRGA